MASQVLSNVLIIFLVVRKWIPKVLALVLMHWVITKYWSRENKMTRNANAKNWRVESMSYEILLGTKMLSDLW